MKISFRIHYHTSWGQQLAVSGTVTELGQTNLSQAFLLNYQKDGFWEGTLDLQNPPKSLQYRYLLLDSNEGSIQPEWGKFRTIELPKESSQKIFLSDHWRSTTEAENVYFSSAFRDVIFQPRHFRRQKPKSSAQDVLLRFCIPAPRVPSGYRLAVIGEITPLGNWDDDNPLLLSHSGDLNWTGEIAVSRFSLSSIEYKYALYHLRSKKIEVMESGPNRKIALDHLYENDLIVKTDLYFNFPEGHWQGAGVAIPVFSIRTKESLGIGEFLDLKPMIEWAHQTGMNMIQILPVNDTSATQTWTDSYPYAAISVFALHPIYLRLDALEGIESAITTKQLQQLKNELNAYPAVEYETVLQHKLKIARSVFASQKEQFLDSENFRKYYRENRHWLPAYAAFCYLKDTYQTADFYQWEDHSIFSESLLKQLTSKNAKSFDQIAFYYYLQYHLDLQLRETADYARLHGIVLKGDLPIGIYRYSADAWVAPELYNMEAQTGAPPDPFSDKGQNWGFPTYNWEVMAQNGYLWWKNRMQQLARYFDAYRIDHILGFFRIWEIPYGQIDGLLGTFKPAIPISRAELTQNGIPFDYQRYCRPYIPEYLLQQLFGDEVEFVKHNFLELLSEGVYQFKPEWDTQRKIRDGIQAAGLDHKKQLLDPLFELINNVLLLEEPGSEGQAFHPRIDLNKTTSFRDLPTEVQNALYDLYLDYFYHRQEEFWRKQAMQKLPALRQATDMLVCGEDLGMVPACVPGVMRQLGILSLEIQRMSKNPKTEFLQAEDIPYLSVASTSTHDMSTTRAWWEESTWEQIQRFFEQELHFIGDHPYYCEPYIAQAIVNQILHWPSMWTIFPIQDLLAMDGKLRHENPFDERINVPANPKHYWRYRMHLSMEDLLKETGFNNLVLQMLRTANRSSNLEISLSADS